jgi:hypothetical protein
MRGEMLIGPPYRIFYVGGLTSWLTSIIKDNETVRTILEFNRDCLILAFHEKPTRDC